MFKKPLTAVAFATACSFVSAEDADITVTYSNFSQPLSQTTGQVRIIGRDEIELLGTLSVDQLLNQISGISVSSEGGLGQLSSIRMRGSDTGDVLVLIDGVPITDTTDIDLNPKTSILNSLNIERIEIVKGNQGAVWGSQALGGVINIITTDTETQVTRAEIGVGSYGQKSSRIKSNWGTDSTHFSFSAGYLKEDGFSVIERRIDDVGSRDEAQAGYEKDPYRERTLMFKAKTRISNIHEVRLSILDVDSALNYDSTSDPNATTKRDTELTQFIVTHDAKLGPESVLTTQLSKVTNERLQDTSDTTSIYKGAQTTASQKYQTFGNHWQATYGLSVSQDTLDSAWGSPVISKTETYQLSTVQSWTTGNTRWNTALAYQARSEFENGATYRLGLKHQFQPEIALGANISTGFKAPSLYQLGCTAAYPCIDPSTTLNPQKSKGTEIFVETSFGTWTLFESEVTDRIDYDLGSGVYFNDIGQSKTSGWEYSHRFNSLESISHSVSHTYVEAEEASGLRRVRIPETETTFRTLWAVSDPLLIGLDIRRTGSRLSARRDLETGNFTVSDLFGTYRISTNTALNMRVENLTDTFYQDAVNASSGYATRGRGYYLTLQSEF